MLLRGVLVFVGANSACGYAATPSLYKYCCMKLKNVVLDCLAAVKAVPGNGRIR